MFPKSARRKEAVPVDYRNSYGKPRKLTLRSGTIRLKRPRVRDTETRREQILPLFDTQELGDGEPDPPELYLHGLPKGDFGLALRGLLAQHALTYGLHCGNGSASPGRPSLRRGSAQR